METVPGSLCRASAEIWKDGDGSLCDTSQPPCANLLLQGPVPRLRGGGGVDAHRVVVCFSTHPSSTEDNSEDLEGRSRGGSDRPALGKTTMVLQPQGDVMAPSSPPSRQTRHLDTGSNLPSTIKLPAPDSLEVERQPLAA